MALQIQKAWNVTRHIGLADRVRVATSFADRFRGLLGTASLPAGEGLWIFPCQSVHSFFMQYPIDIVFLDAQQSVLHAQSLLPWRLSPWIRQAVGVLELPVGTLQQSGTQVGDQISWEEN